MLLLLLLFVFENDKESETNVEITLPNRSVTEMNDIVLLELLISMNPFMPAETRMILTADRAPVIVVTLLTMLLREKKIEAAVEASIDEAEKMTMFESVFGLKRKTSTMVLFSFCI